MPQHIGMPFMQTQHMQPFAIIAIMVSQQAWIILQQASSPEVQVMHIPDSVISHLHIPMVRLQVIMAAPFIIIQQLIMPPLII